MPTETITINLDKGWLPDMIPFEMPDGGLIGTSAVLPSVLGYRPDKTWVQYGSATTATKVLRAKTFIHSNGNAYTIFGTAAKLYRLNPDKTLTDVTRLAGAYTATDWCFTQYGDWIIATNGVDAVQVIKDFAIAIEAEALGGSPPICRTVLFYKGHLILANITGSELVTNGSFTGSATGWTLTGSVVYGTNNLFVENGTARQTLAIVAGKTYRVSFDITNAEGASRTVHMSLGGQSFDPIADNGTPQNGSYVVSVTATSTADFLIESDNASARFNIDNISVKLKMPHMLQWSALENVEDFVAAPTTTGADSQDLPDLKGEITDIVERPNGFSIFSQGGTIVNGIYTGGVFTFNFAAQMPDKGSIRNSSVAAGGGVFFFSGRDINFFDGFNPPKSIAQGLRNTVFGGSGSYALSRTYASTNIHVVYDAESQLIYWAYPTAATTQALLAFSIETGQWTYVGSFATTSAFFLMYDDGAVSNVPELSYTGSGDFKIYSHIDGATDTANAQLTTAEIAMPDGNIWVMLNVRPKVSGYSVAPSVTLGSRFNEDDSVTSATAVSVDSVTGWANVRQAGRYHRITTTLGGGTLKSILAKLAFGGER